MIKQNKTESMSQITSEKPWQNKRIHMFPLWFFQCYLTLTVFIFAFGPWPWPVPHPAMLYFFLFSVQCALWFGYRKGIKSRPGKYTGRCKLNRLIKISLIFNLFWIIPDYLLRSKVGSFNVGEMLASIATGMANPSAVYAAKVEAISDSSSHGSMLIYSTIIASTILYLLVPLAVVYWQRMNLILKFGFIFFLVADLLSWVSIGTNKGIADYVMLLPWLIIANNPKLISKISLRGNIKYFLIGGVALFFFLIFFMKGQEGRGTGEIRMYDYYADISVDTNNWMVFSLPPEGQGAVAAIATYLTQGYYALSLSLEEPFIFTYGVGNSYFLTGIVESFAGEDIISDRTYPARIEKYGWDRFGKWSSFYSWIASDVSFPGVIIVVFLIGKLFAQIWIDVLYKENPFAVVLFALLITMLVYFPANNQVFSFYRTAIPFWIILFYWKITRRKIVYYNDGGVCNV